MQTVSQPTSRPVQILEASVAERIAAGEVIERPSSVVKELVENSLDAGARAVQVSLTNGGKDLIEVVDDGHGMDPASLELSVLRHATSKIARIEDLDALATLGFRGEALPSVAAVAELTVTSRAVGASSAFEIQLGRWGELGADRTGNRTPARAQATTFGHFLNSPHGTLIRAAGLFAQVPARLKFLKSQAAEVSAVREWMERLALAHPAVAFRLLSDGRRILDLKSETEAQRVKSVLSADEDFPIVTIESPREGLRLHWVQGLSLPHSRRIAQVVNRRATRDRLLQQAMLQAFRQALLPGQFPALALFAEIDPASLDVNVHPTKSEVRFLESRKIFRAVEELASRAIARHGAPAMVPESRPSWAGVQPSFQAQGLGFTPSSLPPLGRAEPESDVPLTWDKTENQSRTETETETETEISNRSFLSPQNFVGPLFNTYLAYDLGTELVLVDQHAAHERIRYEALKKRLLSRRADPSAMISQDLLIPEAIHFAEEAKHTLEARLTWLERLGFAAELFGESAVLFRAVPADWGTHDLKARLKNIVERVIEIPAERAQDLIVDESLFEKLASEACHSSIRGGDRLNREEALAITERLFATDHPWNCPHGRPTVVRIPKGKLEEWFQRRV